MTDYFAPLKDQIHKLWSRVDLMPVIRWATVVQASPLRVMLDGDLEMLPFTPASLVRDVAEGARVVCVEQHRRVTVIDAPRAGLARRIGSAQAITGTQSGITTTLTEVTGTSVAFTLDAPATVVFAGAFATFSGDASDVVAVVLRNNTTTVEEATLPANSSPSAINTSRRQQINGEVALPAGSHRLNLAVRRAAGNGTVTVYKGTTTPARLIVDRIL